MPDFDEEEEDTAVIERSVLENRQKIQKLCEEFLSDE